MSKTDYSQWSRKTELPEISSSATKIEQTRAGSACSSLCRHQWLKPRSPPLDENKRSSQRKHLKELELKLDLQRRVQTDLLRRKQRLLSRNMELMSMIENKEDRSYGRVNDALESYERRRNGLAELRHRFERQKENTQTEIDGLKDKLDTELGSLTRQLSSVEAQLSSMIDELQHLKNYKNNEYELRVLDMMGLEQNITQLTLKFQEETSELQCLIDTESDKLTSGDQKTCKQIKEKIANDVFSQMHTSIKEMALQNQNMEKDICFHTHQMKVLQREIDELEEKNSSLVHQPETHIRQTLFPHLYNKFEKCTPDMDIILDIPLPLKLPV